MGGLRGFGFLEGSAEEPSRGVGLALLQVVQQFVLKFGGLDLSFLFPSILGLVGSVGESFLVVVVVVGDLSCGGIGAGVVPLGDTGTDEAFLGVEGVDEALSEDTADAGSLRVRDGAFLGVKGVDEALSEDTVDAGTCETFKEEGDGVAALGESCWLADMDAEAPGGSPRRSAAAGVKDLLVLAVNSGEG